ncbi:MAG: leucine-rich repeat domain-containing protein [Bacteroidia bacterium]
MSQLLSPFAMLVKDSQQVRSFSLKGRKLEQLPIDVSVFSQLEQLDLSGNLLRKLPENLTKLKKLKRINLSANFRMNWSQAIGVLSEIKSLEQLNISNNGLTQLPAELYHLDNLTNLVVDYNPLNVFADRNLMNLPSNLEKISLNECNEGEIAIRLKNFDTLKSLKTNCYDYDFLQRIHFLLPNATVLVQ